MRYLERIEKYRFYYARDNNINTEGSDGEIPDSSGNGISDIDTELTYAENQETSGEKTEENEPEPEDVLMQGEEVNPERDRNLEKRYGSLFKN